MKTKPAVKQYCQWHETMETPAECSMKPTIAPAAPSHTPTPWHVRIVKYGSSRTGVIEDSQDGYIGEICDNKTGPDVAIANANHIVKCVNTHDILIHALKYDYLKNTNALLLDALKRMGATWHNQFCSDTGHESECIMADEAIAKAEGK